MTKTVDWARGVLSPLEHVGQGGVKLILTRTPWPRSKDGTPPGRISPVRNTRTPTGSAAWQ